MICYHHRTSRVGISEQDMLNVSPDKLAWWVIRVGDEWKELLFKTVQTSTIDPSTYRCKQCGKQFTREDLTRQQEIFHYVENKTVAECLKYIDVYSDTGIFYRLDSSTAQKVLSYKLRWAYLLGKIPRHDFTSDVVFLKLAEGLEPVRLDTNGAVAEVLSDPSDWGFI